MTMWRVSIKPIEDNNAWISCMQQGIIVIGWPKRKDDNVPQVRRFRRIKIGDLIAAHVPESHGGGPGMILGIGHVTSGYRYVLKNQLPNGDRWNDNARRQYQVEWLALEAHDLRGILNYWRGTVHRLRSSDERSVLDAFGING